MEPTGRIVATQIIEHERFHPNLTALATGIYFIRINNTNRFIKVLMNNKF